MSSLRKKIIAEHIEKYYPHAQILDYDSPNTDFKFYTAQQLQSVEENWFPLSCHIDAQTGEAVYGGRKNIIHTYTEGETGAGKTTRFVMQALRALSSTKGKPSFVIVDIHGEIIENLHSHFIENGYDVKILNCDDPQRSDTYNPFSELTAECLEEKAISNDVMNKIRKISEIIQPIESTEDPIWDQGARSYTNGCILDKFEDLIHGDIPPQCLTIYNVIQNHYWLRQNLNGSFGQSNLFNIEHYKKKGPGALSVQKMISVTNNAEKTRASYFGVIENHYDTFGQPALYSLSSNSTIDISDFIDKPTVIVIQSGNTKIGDDLISLLMNEIYTYVVKVGKRSPTKKLPRNIHCFLDEFANCNIADGPEYIKMLTTSRKFGMFWHMILQCDAQLDRKFGNYIGQIIRANSTEIFMGSHDYDTEVRFAKSCGQTTIESLASTIAQQQPLLETVDLMTPERLNLTEDGYVYVKSSGYPLTKTFIEAFYNCKEFTPVADIDSVYPHNSYDFRQTEFCPDDLPSNISSRAYLILEALQTEPCTQQALAEKFPDFQVVQPLRELLGKDLAEKSHDQTYHPIVSKRDWALYTLRQQWGLLSRYEEADDEEEDDPLPFSDEPFADLDTPIAEDDLIDLDDEVDGREAPLFIELKEHLQYENKVRVLEELEDLTCVPQFLYDAVEFLSLPAEKQEQTVLDFPASHNIIKFEILESFIIANDFEEKQQWEEEMEKEYDQLTSQNLLPPNLLYEFKVALAELKNDLTLSNIREIKKIINDNQ